MGGGQPNIINILLIIIILFLLIISVIPPNIPLHVNLALFDLLLVRNSRRISALETCHRILNDNYVPETVLGGLELVAKSSQISGTYDATANR